MIAYPHTISSGLLHLWLKESTVIDTKEGPVLSTGCYLPYTLYRLSEYRKLMDQGCENAVHDQTKQQKLQHSTLSNYRYHNIQQHFLKSKIKIQCAICFFHIPSSRWVGEEYIWNQAEGKLLHFKLQPNWMLWRVTSTQLILLVSNNNIY